MSKVAVMSRVDTTDCLRIGWNSPELSERLTMLVIVGSAHCFRRQVGNRWESDCLLGQPRRRIFEISASEAGWKVEKSGGDED